jgi:hypothetical protein
LSRVISMTPALTVASSSQRRSGDKGAMSTGGL